ncbi:MAG TPA: metal ABC transporter substrate-binding protein [Herpetosiphonaceae bacterium]
METPKHTPLRSGRWRRVSALLLILLIGGPLLAACGQAASARPSLNVVATLAPLADWARQVGREHVQVTQIVPAGIDPKTYVLTQRDRAAIDRADVLLLNGYELEPWLDQALAESMSPPRVTLDLSQYLGVRNNGTHAIVRTPLEGEERGGEKSEIEQIYIPPSVVSPYLWLDPGPTMAQQAVMLIADTFTRADLDNLLAYRRNADQYNGELENLDNWIKRQIRGWPRVRAGTKELLALQAVDRSWHYFAQHYAINLRTTVTISTFEPTIPAVTPLFVDQFLSESERQRLLGLRQPDGVLNPLADNSYIELMKHNVNIMTQGVQRAARREPLQFNLQVIGS